MFVFANEESGKSKKDLLNKINGNIHSLTDKDLQPKWEKDAKASIKNAMENPSRVHNQGSDVRSNVAADSNSVGSQSYICFYFNNQLELDVSSYLVIRQSRDPSVETDSRGIFGDTCIYGDTLGGLYNWEYHTQNRFRTGTFAISGDYPSVQVELNTKIFDQNDFTVTVQEGAF